MLNEGTTSDDVLAHAADAVAAFTLLTPTQRKVLEGVHHGLLNKQIAYNLGIAEATVKAHMTALMRKLKVRNRTQVALLARSLADGLSHDPVRH